MSPVQTIPPTVTIASPQTNINNNINIENSKYIIENTTKTTLSRKVMSDALSISNITQKQMAYETPHSIASAGILGGGGGGAVSVEQSAVAAVAAAAAYQFNYSHFADRAAVAAAMYPSIMFSAPPAHPMFTVSAPVPAHAYKLNNNNISNSIAAVTDSSTVFSAAYFKAIQNAVTAGIFNPTQMTSQQIPTTSPTSKLSPVHTLTPPTSTPTLPKSPTLAASMSSLAVSCATSPVIVSSHSNNATTGGTYLNEKAAINNAKTTTTDVNYFKVPSGKEGSLKHRILTRPQNTAHNLSATNCHSFINYEDNNSQQTASVMRTYDTTSNFRKGSYIELANGVLRKVEDMRTEDFIQCAERSPQHKLAESTVVKIDLTQANTVIITFSYDKNRSKADVEVSHDHPFFVYGQGWASYNPEASSKVFDLKCQRLQVGDICISLTKRDDAEPVESVVAPAATKNIAATTTAMNMTMSAAQPPAENIHYQMPIAEYPTATVLPLSPHTTPVDAASAMVNTNTSSHLSMPPTISAAHYAAAPGRVALHGLPYHLLPTHPYATPEMADFVSAYAYHAHAHMTSAQTPAAKVLNSHYYHHPQTPHVYHSEVGVAKDTNSKLSNQEVVDYKHYHARYDTSLAPSVSHHYHSQSHPPLAPPSPHHHHQQHQQHQQQQQQQHHYPQHHHQLHHQHQIQHQHQHQHQHHEQEQDQPVDATTRKRRWSAPEGVCDDEEEEHHQPMRLASVSSSSASSSSSSIQQNNNTDSGGSMYKIFKPSPVVAAAPPVLGNIPI